MGLFGPRVGSLGKVVAVSENSKTDDSAGKDPNAATGSSEELTPQERIDATIWRVIRDLALVARLKGTGRRQVDLTLEEQNDLLEPLIPTLVGVQGMLRECGQQYYLLGLNNVHQRLHGQAGIDHEMLDQALEFHSNQTGEAYEDEPFILEK